MFSKWLTYALVQIVTFIPNLFARLSLKVLPPMVYFLLYRVLKYRKNEVTSNLKRCFKDDDKVEIYAKQYYKHLSRMIVEPLLTKGLSRKYLASRVRGADDVMNELHRQGKNVFIVMGHMGNWEWLSTVAAIKSPYDSTCVYKKLSNPYMEKLIKRTRGRFGTGLVEMRGIPRLLAAKRAAKKPFILSFIADQIPSHDNCKVVPFFGERMYFFDGYEKLAKRVGAVVVYFESEIKGNEYIYHTRIINDFSEKPNYDKTVEDFVKLLEQNIRKEPYNWLWSHKRWKRMPE
jgi:KDO2-lipid IV(A) lauroyltransferase